MIPNKEKFNLVNWEIVSVNPVDKNWRWSDLFCFWAVNIQSIIGFSLISSLYLVYDLNFFVVFFGGLIAALLAVLFSNLIGKPSQKNGLPFPVVLRSSVGVNGARYIALIRGLVGIFMFGVQTFFLAKAIGYLIRIFLFSQQGNILDSEIFLSFFMDLPLTNAFLSISEINTFENLYFIILSTQGGFFPICEQGSKVVYIVAPSSFFLSLT